MSENKNAVLVFNEARQHSFSAQKDCLVTLNPGRNVVSIAKLEKLTEGDAKSIPFIELMETGVIEVVSEEAVVVAETTDSNSSSKKPTADKIEINIVDLGAKEAIALINSESDVDVIQGYLDAENTDSDPRKTVVKACDEAITALLADPSTDGDSE